MPDHGVVDEDIHAAELGAGGAHQCFDLAYIAQIRLGVACLHTGCALQRGQLLADLRSTLDAVQHDMAAVDRQPLRDRQPKPAGRASNERATSLKWSVRHAGSLLKIRLEGM
jgi:hypothetical protein